MNVANQRYLTKKIYLLHRSNNGLLKYLDFKNLVPSRMSTWIQSSKLRDKNINNYRAAAIDGLDMLAYLNERFIKNNYDLYSIHGYEPPQTDSNVYRNKLLVTYMTDGGKTLIVEKNPNELLAGDMGNIDVWAKQTVEVSNANKRYNNAIVPWQASMHTRNYDRGNQGYAHADFGRASLDTPIYGYGPDIKKLHSLVDQQLNRNQTVDRYA